MAQITSTTINVTPTSGEDWINIPLNPQKVLMAYKTTEAINGADLTLYPAIAFLVDYSFKIKDNPFVMTKENWSFWIYASGDTATRDADFLIVNDKIGEVGSGGGGGEVNTASNVGAGDGVFKQKTGVDLEFKTLIAGTNITIVNNPNDLTLSSTGGGGGRTTVINPATPYVPSNGDIILWDTTAGNKVIDLPVAAVSTDFVVDVKKTDITDNTITINPNGVELIDDGSDAVITCQFEDITTISDGVEWWII